MTTLSPTPFDNNWYACFSDELLTQFEQASFVVLDDCFSQTDLHALQAESGFLAYKDAHLTHGERIRDIRGDGTHWIDDGCPAGMAYLASIERLGQFFNQCFYLGIRRAEAHYACYPVGAGYQWHSDNPAGRDERVLSAVYYLNDDWGNDDGGEISVIDKLGNRHKLTPKANRLVLFDSNLRHQVEITKRVRYSIATWLRRDDGVL